MTEPTDAEILDLWELFVGEPTEEIPLSDSDKLCFARAALRSWGQPSGAGEAAEHYRNAIASACEGWTMPGGLRKHLETALWSPPTPQPTHAQAGAVPLTDGRILELAGLAPDRKVCASTCMAAKFDKKPCECYPTSASRSEVVTIARAIEAAHGIKGGQHGADT